MPRPVKRGLSDPRVRPHSRPSRGVPARRDDTGTAEALRDEGCQSFVTSEPANPSEPMTHVLDRAAAHAAKFLETVQNRRSARPHRRKSCARVSRSLFPKTAWRPRRSSMSSCAMSRAEFWDPSTRASSAGSSAARFRSRSRRIGSLPSGIRTQPRTSPRRRKPSSRRCAANG